MDKVFRKVREVTSSSPAGRTQSAVTSHRAPDRRRADAASSQRAAPPSPSPSSSDASSSASESDDEIHSDAEQPLPLGGGAAARSSANRVMTTKERRRREKQERRRERDQRRRTPRLTTDQKKFKTFWKSAVALPEKAKKKSLWESMVGGAGEGAGGGAGPRKASTLAARQRGTRVREGDDARQMGGVAGALLSMAPPAGGDPKKAQQHDAYRRSHRQGTVPLTVGELREMRAAAAVLPRAFAWSSKETRTAHYDLVGALASETVLGALLAEPDVVPPLPAREPQGWLLKRSKKSMKWQPRYFVLRGMLLFYYEDEDLEGAPLGCWPIEGAAIASRRPTPASEGYEFSVSPFGRVGAGGARDARRSDADALQLAAESGAQRAQWVRLLARRAGCRLPHDAEAEMAPELPAVRDGLDEAVWRVVLVAADERAGAERRGCGAGLGAADVLNLGRVLRVSLSNDAVVLHTPPECVDVAWTRPLSALASFQADASGSGLVQLRFGNGGGWVALHCVDQGTAQEMREWFEIVFQERFGETHMVSQRAVHEV